MEAIKITDVCKYYGRIMALNRLNLTVNEGEIYGFIGPNGAGKSTTIRLLLNFLNADRGEISVLGLSPSKDHVSIKKQTGYVSSDTFMYHDMKVHDLLRFTEKIRGLKDRSRSRYLIDLLDIDTKKRFGQLSFGNRKKVSVACALIHSPRLIILDEPSNGLDPVIRINLYELLKEEQKNGATIFYSSHVLSEVQKFCTRIGLIKDGMLIRETTAAEFTNLGYRLVFIETEDRPDLTHLNGIAGFKVNGKAIQFMYSGNFNELIKILGQINVTSVHIEEPDLENVFMHYFKSENNDSSIV